MGRLPGAIKYPELMAKVDEIVKRLFAEDITTGEIAVEYKVDRQILRKYIRSKIKPRQWALLRRKGYKLGARKRCDRNLIRKVRPEQLLLQAEKEIVSVAAMREINNARVTIIRMREIIMSD